MPIRRSGLDSELRKGKMHPWLALLVLFFGPWPHAGFLLSAQEEAPDQEWVQYLNEYFLTQSVYPQDRGEVQLTLLPSLESGDPSLRLLPLSLELGLTDRWAVEVEWVSFMSVRPSDERKTGASGDLEIGAQRSFMGIGGSDYHAALGFGVSWPTGSLARGTTEGFIEYETSFAWARDFSRPEGLQLFGQVGLAFLQRHTDGGTEAEDEPEAHELSLGTGFMVPVGRARLSGELSLFTNTWNNGGEEQEIYLTPGFTWDLPGSWEVGAGLPVGMTSDAADLRLILILLWEFDLGE
jgi:hypothetical protein